MLLFDIGMRPGDCVCVVVHVSIARVVLCCCLSCRIRSWRMESRSFNRQNGFVSEVGKQGAAGAGLQQQLSLPQEQDLIKAEYGSTAQQHKAKELLQAPESAEVCYIGVDKVPGRARWPYRAVLSLPAWMTGSTSPHQVVCEGYYSTPEAAARAVDTICMVLLGQQAAVNFPPTSYNAADLEDASKYIQCISGAFPDSSCCAAASGCALQQAAALMLAPLLTHRSGSRGLDASQST